MKRVLIRSEELDENSVEWIGDIAVILNIISMMPQLWHVYQRHDARSLSYLWLATSLVANFLWLTYGLKKGVAPLIYSSSFFITAFILLGTMKYMFDR